MALNTVPAPTTVPVLQATYNTSGNYVPATTPQLVYALTTGGGGIGGTAGNSFSSCGFYRGAGGGGGRHKGADVGIFLGDHA